MRYLATLALGLMLAGCAGQSATVTAQTSVADACNAYSAALDQLTPVKASLPIRTVAAIDNANALTGPLCRPGVLPSDPASAISFIAGETAAILAIVHGAA
jgi:hypothetical protein